MEKFSKLVVKYKKSVIAFFLTLAIISSVLATFISVNYNMVDYLPKDAQSTVAISLMKEEFSGETPNARVMLKNTSLEKVLEYKEKIAKISGVKAVNWLDDMISKDTLLNTPLEYLDASIIENYYKNGNALLDVSIQNGEEISTVEDIRLLIGEKTLLLVTQSMPQQSKKWR